MTTILNSPESEVILFDNLQPEAAAMVLAMYSRDPRSVRVHLEQVARVGPGKFMSQYYVGYGHKSIGDCGSTTICAENISLLAAKAIQHNRLYNGQEASTRYLDMTAQPVLNPLGTEQGEKVQRGWMKLYEMVLAEVAPVLKERFPMLGTDDSKLYEKAIKAKAFDIARAFLPAGCTTYVGWHTNLRQAWDHLKELSFHPLKEVKNLAETMLAQLREKYPSSFNFKSYPDQDEYLRICADHSYIQLVREKYDFNFSPSLDIRWIRDHPDDVELLKKRPPKTELPDLFDKYGQVYFSFLLDFGSFRDLQRHRSCYQIMPILSLQHGFNTWYIDQLGEELQEKVVRSILEQEKEIARLGETDEERLQYYIAIGYNVACELTAGLPSAVYIAELRSGQTVHPTLRLIAQRMGQCLKSSLPEMALHCDMSPDEWSTARGKHDIVKK